MRNRTTAANSAALIRKDLKALGVNAQVTSKNYSGGCSVRVVMKDERPEVFKKVEKALGKYEYGTFDGMTDSYNYDNVIKDLPQVKFLFVNNEMSDAMKQAAYDHLRTGWKGGETLPPTYEAGYNVHFQGDYISSLVWRLFNGATPGFWPQTIAA